MEKKYQADTLIVGAGLAGMVAALELLGSGQQILMIDRDEEAALGGLARWSFGGMFFVDTKHQRRMGIKDSIDLAKKDWWSFAEFAEDEYWGQQWADQYIHLCRDHGYRWLRARDVNFFPVLNWPERGLLRHGNSLPRFHMVWGTGHGLVQALIGQLRKHPKAGNLRIVYRHRVQSLIVSGKTVTGVRGKTEKDGLPFEAHADNVIIATGGINGSIERLKENWYKPWGPPPETILNGAHKYAIGDMHDATTAIEGSVVNLDKQWNYAAGIRHYQPRKPDHGLSLVPGKSQLWLTYEGKRFGPMPLMSPWDTRYLVEQVCRQPVKYSWQLLNQKIANKEFAISGAEHNEAVRDKKWLKFILSTVLLGKKKLVDKIAAECEDLIVADSLEELVAKMNALTGEQHVKLAYVRAAAEHYDSEILKGPKYFNDEQLRRIMNVRKYRGDRVRTCKFQRILDPKARPLIAIRSFILSRKSLGGIQTDLQSRVLTRPDAGGQQQAIEGLYAVGESAGFGGGGMHGLRSLEGTFLGGCVITARVAAADIMGRKLA